MLGKVSLVPSSAVSIIPGELGSTGCRGVFKGDPPPLGEAGEPALPAAFAAGDRCIYRFCCRPPPPLSLFAVPKKDEGSWRVGTSMLFFIFYIYLHGVSLARDDFILSSR